MCRLIETLKIEDGIINNVDFHNHRMNKARSELLHCRDTIDLSKEIKDVPSGGVIKCRILYRSSIHEIQFIPYSLPVIRSLQVVRDDQIDYTFKYENRKKLKTLFEQRKSADDILIIKNGCVTDSYFCNVVFEKSGLFFTPSTCLLAGTKRQILLNTGKIQEKQIQEKEIMKYEKIHLVNAMIDLEGGVSIDTERISF